MTDTISVRDPGDLSLDDLFPNTDGVIATAAPPAPATTSPAQPQTFVYTYADREAAERGIAEKDRLIAEQNDRIKKMEAASKPAVPLATTPGAPKPYLDQVVDAINAAQTTGNKAEYERVQREFIFNTLGPAGNLLLDNARINVVAQVDRKLPGFKVFYDSPEYGASLEALPPAFVNGVKASESDINGIPYLPDLYETVYLASQGRRVPELLKQTQTTASAEAQTQTARPTLSATTQAPPTISTNAPDPNTVEGRKVLIAEYERRGVQNVVIK